VEIAIRRISFAELYSHPDFIPVVDRYWDEGHVLPFRYAPHIQTYLALEDAGVMHILASMGGGRLIGFAIVLATLYPHYSRRFATCESLFVVPEHRKGGHGVKLLAAVRALAKEQKCEGLLISAPCGGQLAEVLTKSKRFRETNRIFAEVFGERTGQPHPDPAPDA